MVFDTTVNADDSGLETIAEKRVSPEVGGWGDGVWQGYLWIDEWAVGLPFFF